MMQETVGGDVEHEPAFALTPGCVRYGTPVVVAFGSRAGRVNSRIRPTGAYYCDTFPAQLGCCRFENTLNGSLTRLSLPAGKAGAIVVQHELHGPRQHRVKLSSKESLSRNVTY